MENENSLYKKLWELQAGGFLKSETEEAEEEIETEDEEGEENVIAKKANF